MARFAENDMQRGLHVWGEMRHQPRYERQDERRRLAGCEEAIQRGDEDHPNDRRQPVAYDHSGLNHRLSQNSNPDVMTQWHRQNRAAVLSQCQRLQVQALECSPRQAVLPEGVLVLQRLQRDLRKWQSQLFRRNGRSSARSLER